MPIQNCSCCIESRQNRIAHAEQRWINLHAADLLCSPIDVAAATLIALPGLDAPQLGQVRRCLASTHGKHAPACAS